MNNQNQSTTPSGSAVISFQTVERLHELQEDNYAGALADSLDEVVDFFICETELNLEDAKKLDFLFAVRMAQQVLRGLG